MQATATCVIVNKYGFHVRPTKMFLELAKTFESEVKVRAGGMEVLGDSPMQLMSLGAVAGTEIEIVCDGPDAEEACEALRELVDGSFDGIE